jgi:hypothetical protein
VNDQLQAWPLFLEERTPDAKLIESLMEFAANEDASVKRIVYWLCRKSKHYSSVVQQLNSHYSDYAGPIPFKRS